MAPHTRCPRRSTIMPAMDDKRPRSYAFEIAAMTTREERREAIGRVPEHLRAMVMTHVIAIFEKRNKKTR